MTNVNFLKDFSPFRKAPDALLSSLSSAGQLRSLPAGTQIYRDGDSCGAIAFVRSGEIRVYKVGQTGREITLYEIGPGETCILNASCILSGTTYPAHAAATTDVEAVLVPSDTFRGLVDKYEVLRDFIFTLLSQRLVGVMELVEEVAFGRMDQRLMDYLVEKSDQNRLETTHQKIANDLGTSREVVSRLLKDLERKGKVRMSRHEITLLD